MTDPGLLDARTAFALSAIAVIGATVIAVRRLAAFEIGQGDD